MSKSKDLQQWTTWRQFCVQWQLQLFALVGILLLIIFSYIPLFGIVIAFEDFSINKGFAGIFTSKWNNFKFFKEFFTYYRFGELLRNTLVISMLKLVFSFIAPVFLAILLNEMRNKTFRRIVQTVSYLPNFISWVLVYTLATAFLNTDIGVVNQVLLKLGIIKEAIPLM